MQIAAGEYCMAPRRPRGTAVACNRFAVLAAGLSCMQVAAGEDCTALHRREETAGAGGRLAELDEGHTGAGITASGGCTTLPRSDGAAVALGASLSPSRATLAEAVRSGPDLCASSAALLRNSGTTVQGRMPCPARAARLLGAAGGRLRPRSGATV